ncbi:hypothetical protein [Acinetobacter rudis]|uniref:Uncharacterized protein n=1 Tax=Acinetobacter rudis TaxID=632955 RepID=A0AAW8J6M2_9GAMM|nr:hypothetical protein [Acinetobacter rudis]MDQ8934845.1 hypothetical protein [Acinetobacter rudis]MDQ9017246.1 hypothetical protein [Acinetobacter rudis]
MSKFNQLYAFFCAEDSSTKNELVINLDNTLSSIGEVTQYIGSIVYKDYPDDNPIMGRCNQYYFGGTSPDGFRDCLMSYLELINTNISLRFNIRSLGADVTDKECYIFLYTLATCMFDFDFDSRLKVYVSKDILEIYLKESDRLLVLDTDPSDYVQF